MNRPELPKANLRCEEQLPPNYYYYYYYYYIAALVENRKSFVLHMYLVPPG